MSDDLFKPIAPFRSGMLAMDEFHRLYWEVSGNPEGCPVLFLHGGPGAGCAPVHRQFFNPRLFRIILFDQRGAGRSTPGGALHGNSLAHLIMDMERLRQHLGVRRWLLFGGSWGSTLALAYARVHPGACIALVLRGIFLGTRAEIDWFVNGMGRFFPEAARAFAAHIPKEERADLLDAYYRRLTDDDPGVHRPAAAHWGWYENACSTLMPPPPEQGMQVSDRQLAMARIEAHYMKNDMFLEEDTLLASVAKIRHIPAHIVQGRYDVICPIAGADKLAGAWPEAHYEIIADAGHSAMEPGIRQALMAAVNRFSLLR